MSDKKRIVIKRRLIPEPTQPEQQVGELTGAQEVEKQGPEPQEIQVQPTAQQPTDNYEEAIKSFDNIQAKLREIREMDRSIQRVFKKWDEVDLRSVKKKLNQLSDERNALLSEAQTCENLLNEALGLLESRMSELEEQLFDRLVEVEFLRSRESSLSGAESERLKALEAEVEEYRNRIAEIKKQISDLQVKLDNIRSLPRTIVKLTTSTEEAEPLYKELVAKYRDEARVASAIEKIMQDEGVSRPYAIIHLWKAALKPRVSGQ
jgi:DNA repair exonuclease SbcCD ATPase subunit